MPSERCPALLTLSLSLMGVACKCAIVKCSSSSHTGEASQVARVVMFNKKITGRRGLERGMNRSTKDFYGSENTPFDIIIV